MFTQLNYTEKEQLGQILQYLADSIDLTESQYQLATDRYNAVGSFLGSTDSILYNLKPQIKSQGSFRTGTATRPLDENLEFDVDLTCLLQVALPNSQYKIKDLVGQQLKSKETYKNMLLEMQRCWRLKYAESSRFHLDIVPGIPDSFQWLLDQGVPLEYAKHAINITDNERPDYEAHSYQFPKSNPEGYALWFLDIMKVESSNIRLKLKSQLNLNKLEDVPDYKVRTPLQKGIQLMKRHRDVLFKSDKDRPISIIIATLAARAYEFVLRNKRSDLFYDIVLQIAQAMPMFIEVRNGVKWIPNPVNPKENFADKWQIKKIKEANFFKWHNSFLSMLESNKLNQGQPAIALHLKEFFGNKSVNESMNLIGENTRIQREKGDLRITSSGIIGSIGSTIKNHSFDGSE